MRLQLKTLKVSNTALCNRELCSNYSLKKPSLLNKQFTYYEMTNVNLNCLAREGKDAKMLTVEIIVLFIQTEINL